MRDRVDCGNGFNDARLEGDGLDARKGCASKLVNPMEGARVHFLAKEGLEVVVNAVGSNELCRLRQNRRHGFVAFGAQEGEQGSLVLGNFLRQLREQERRQRMQRVATTHNDIGHIASEKSIMNVASLDSR